MRFRMEPPTVPENRLLQLFSADARAELGPLVTVRLAARQELLIPGAPTLHAYFPLTAVVSLISTMESGASAEVALVGREGMIGLASVFGTIESQTAALVLVPGLAVRVPITALRAARADHGTVRAVLDAYTQARFIQLGQTAACNRLHRVEARLARWLLEVHERIEGDELVVSQELIAGMLGIQRPTVSSALQGLQQDGALSRRGRTIVITSRHTLEHHACECHAVIGREFERLLTGPVPPVATLPAITTATARKTDATDNVDALREIAGRLLMVSLREHEAREQAETATRSRDQFLAMISHELRTPLAAILGWCATLSAYPDRPASHGIEVIARNARAQLTLVNDLLDAAHVSSATFSITPQPVSLPEIVSHVLDTLRPAADEKHVTLAATNTGEESAGRGRRPRPPAPGAAQYRLELAEIHRPGRLHRDLDRRAGRSRASDHPRQRQGHFAVGAATRLRAVSPRRPRRRRPRRPGSRLEYRPLDRGVAWRDDRDREPGRAPGHDLHHRPPARRALAALGGDDATTSTS